MNRFMNSIARLSLLACMSGMAGYPCMAMEPLNDRRPYEHICPITLQVMTDPVVAADGHSYERKAIQEYFKVNHSPKSPLNGSPLKNKDLVDNHALKTMIREWRLGIQGEPSVLETRDSASIAQRVREEFYKNAALLNSAKDQHIVAFLGNTGAGKSTLVNLLGGKEIRISSDEEDYVLVNPGDKTAMPIGTGGSSETLYPKSIDVDGLRFFDLPGFNDTDGSERNLMNAAFIRKILLDAASVRLVFVVGQDQFTADRSASVRQMFNSLKQLFVVGEDANLVDKGIFVATKVTCAEQTEMTDFLLRRTDSRDKAELNEQLKSWKLGNRLCRMFHPLRDDSNKGVRNQILGLIKSTHGVKIQGVNVSALYPPDTKGSLERMFLSVIEDALDRKFKELPVTLSDYDRVLAYYTSEGFWQKFDTAVCAEDEAVGLLKEFYINPYNKAMKNLEEKSKGELGKHIHTLKKGRDERVQSLENRTEARIKEVISSLVQSKEKSDFVSFDFAYHKDFYDQVFSPSSISQLAGDVSEQDVVHRSYAGFISRHSHEQMKRWHEKFSGIEKLKESQAIAQQSIEVLMEQVAELQREMQERERRAAEEERVAIMEQRLKVWEEERSKEEKQPAEIKLTVPLVAQGYEQIYRRFLNGVLIYRPDGKSDEGRINLPIASLVNPLEGTFDLSQCGDTGKSLSISTGYRKGKKAENATKLEIWFTPRFLVEKELQGTASHFQEIFPAKWKDNAPVGIIWTWGGWDYRSDNFDYLTMLTMEEISNKNLYDCARAARALPIIRWHRVYHQAFTAECWSAASLFHVHFVN
jgi:predicted GTPase